MQRDRKAAYRKGHWAEWFAAIALMAKGYRIVSRRFKTPVGEIDLIARRGQLVIFVEVKARANQQLALDSITRTAQQRISNSAQWWLTKQPDAANLNWRFDVVAVLPAKWPIHFEDVW